MLGEPEFLAGQIGLTTILVQGFGDLWLALRSYLPRPLDPEKYYQFGQTVKQRFKDEVPWMKDNINVTFHKVVDHPREILTQVPDTLRISLLSEEGLEVNFVLIIQANLDLCNSIFPFLNRELHLRKIYVP